MNMLDRYIQEVGRRLPRQNRADLQAEIRSNLEELIEDRAQQSGRAIDEALTAEVLKAYGAPEKVAESYCPTRYLIGPRLYPFFTMVLKIVITVLFAVGLGGFILNYFTGDLGAEFLPALGQYGLEFLAGAISAFGNIVIVFAILERVLPPSELSKDETEWDPAQLNATPNPDEIKRNELIVDILFTVLILAALNLYTNRIGIYWLEDNAWVMIPFLSDAFFSYLPWINLLWVLQVYSTCTCYARGCGRPRPVGQPCPRSGGDCSGMGHADRPFAGQAQRRRPGSYPPGKRGRNPGAAAPRHTDHRAGGVDHCTNHRSSANGGQAGEAANNLEAFPAQNLIRPHRHRRPRQDLELREARSLREPMRLGRAIPALPAAPAARRGAPCTRAGHPRSRGRTSRSSSCARRRRQAPPRRR